jgi:hypothetical protein
MWPLRRGRKGCVYADVSIHGDVLEGNVDVVIGRLTGTGGERRGTR